MIRSSFCCSAAIAFIVLASWIAGGAAHAQAATTSAPGGRVVLVVTLKAKDGQAAALEATFRVFAGKVHASGMAQEFQLTRTAMPGTYKLVEMFKDENALAAHRATDHVKAFGATFGNLLDGQAQVEQLAPID